eukprot:gb/GECG01006752.1/.p1 GENE.gb/GECG01006752.1/~~gb/GECG01006752.1/.p1  ORF type:complete len:161 (+),score=34.48 gb/GECG01006752.1/:1-483(+)
MASGAGDSLKISSIPADEDRVNFHDSTSWNEAYQAQGDNVGIKFLLPTREELEENHLQLNSNIDEGTEETEGEGKTRELPEQLTATFQTAQDVAYLKYFVEKETGIPTSYQGMYIEGEPMLDPLSLADISQIDSSKENVVRVVIEDQEAELEDGDDAEEE